MLNNLKDHDFQKWMEARLKAVEKEKVNDGKEFNDEARKACIEKNIQFIGMAVIFSVLNKIFYSCTDKIISIQEQISMEKNVPAYDFLHLLFKLSYQGIQIEEARIYFNKYNNEKITGLQKHYQFYCSITLIPIMFTIRLGKKSAIS